MFGLFKSRSLSPKQQALSKFIQNKFGFKPDKLDLYEEALRHKSYTKETNLSNNERLEFLGDAILDNIMAVYLFENHREATEGELTQMKSRMVSRKTLGALGVKIGLESMVDFLDGKYVNKQTICGNALEAVVGAIYLDKGFKQAKASAIKLFQKHLDLNSVIHDNDDYKSQILIWSQKNKKELQFKLVLQEDLGHEKNYVYNIICDGELIGEGSGTSKKKAEQNASQQALNKLS